MAGLFSYYLDDLLMAIPETETLFKSFLLTVFGIFSLSGRGLLGIRGNRESSNSRFFFGKFSWNFAV